MHLSSYLSSVGNPGCMSMCLTLKVETGGILLSRFASSSVDVIEDGVLEDFHRASTMSMH